MGPGRAAPEASVATGIPRSITSPRVWAVACRVARPDQRAARPAIIRGATIAPMDQPVAQDRPRTARGSTGRLKELATWGVVIGTALWTTFFFGFLVAGALFPQAVPESWFLRMVQEHPGGTIGIAISAISAFSVVAVLDVLSRDPIEIKFLGFELKGAAGPVVLWTVCFLALVAGGELLWDNSGLTVPASDSATASAAK